MSHEYVMSMSQVIPFWCGNPHRQVQKGPRCRKHDLDPKGKARAFRAAESWERVGICPGNAMFIDEWVDIPRYTMTMTITNYHDV